MRTLISNIKEIHGIHGQEVVHLRGNQLDQSNCIKNAFLLIEDGLINSFGPMSEWNGHADKEIDGSGRLLIPAYSDSHTHLVFAESRDKEFEDRIHGLSYEEIAARGGGILNSAEKLRKMDEQELYERAALRLEELNKLGTANIEIKSGYGLDAEAELKMLRVIRRLKENSKSLIKASFLGAHAIPPEYKGRSKDYVTHMMSTVLPTIADEGLADYIDIFCEKGYFGLEETEMVLNAGAKYGLKAKIHVNQFNAFGGVELAVEHKALSVDHLEEMNEEEFELLGNSNTIATVLPTCSFFLSIPYAPSRRLIDEGAILALASDFNPGSTPSGNMNLVMSTACIKMKMSPTEALHAASLNGAAAMEISNSSGSICIGKRADLILTQAVPSLAYLPYAFGTNWIEKSWVNGYEF